MWVNPSEAGCDHAGNCLAGWHAAQFVPNDPHQCQKQVLDEHAREAIRTSLPFDHLPDSFFSPEIENGPDVSLQFVAGTVPVTI
jgi:hypothetical protein